MRVVSFCRIEFVVRIEERLNALFDCRPMTLRRRRILRGVNVDPERVDAKRAARLAASAYAQVSRHAVRLARATQLVIETVERVRRFLAELLCEKDFGSRRRIRGEKR